MTGVIPDEEFNKQIVRVVKQVLRRDRGYQPPAGESQGQQLALNWAITDEDISEATDAKTEPSTGQVELLSMDTDQDLSRQGEVFTATNRWETISIESDTLVLIARFRGERVIVWAEGTGGRKQGVLLDNVTAPTSPLSPTYGTVKVYEVDDAGVMAATNDCLSVAYRFTVPDLEAGSWCKIEYLDKEWSFYAVDCEDSGMPTTGCS